MNDNDLVFLVQMSGGPTAGRDKSVINAHVSKQTHNRRRRERILQAQRDQELARSYGEPLERINTSIDDTGWQTAGTHLSPTWQEVVGSDSPQRPHTGGCFNTVNPLEVFDAKAEGYLRFGREVLGPAVRHVGLRGWVAPNSPHEGHIDPDFLTFCPSNDDNWHVPHTDHDKIFAFAVLAYCASGIAAIGHSQSAHHDALNYTISCMKNLRKYLDNLNHDINQISEGLVYHLFRAEVLADNQPSAVAHGNLLRNIFEHKVQGTPIALDLLFNTLHQDTHRAFTSWSRPIFDSRWVQRQYRHEWQQADEMFDRSVDVEACRLNKSLCDSTLRPLLITTKRLFLQTQIQIRQRQHATPQNCYWFSSRSECLQMCLMNYYLDRDHDLANAIHEADERDVTVIELNQNVVLATLYLLRHSKSDVHIQGQPLYQGCKNIYMRMDARLSRLARSMTQEHSQQHSEVIMFLLFVAALAENHHLRFSVPSDAGHIWGRRFSQFILARGMTSWKDVAEVLSGFPYTELELPVPYADWFHELMEETVPG